ncbi:TPA: alkaline phosphatase [Candidatus Acetothermia bacterium]|nr:alkaline phosphatase [Candidatus Acetothermia bacterium]
MSKRKIVIAAILLSALFIGAGVVGFGDDDTVTVGAIYIGPIGDYGWSFVAHRDLTYLVEKHDWLEYLYAEAVPFPEAEGVIRDYGPGGRLAWDELPHVAITTVHVRDNLQAGSVGGAVAHSTGIKSYFGVFGFCPVTGQPLTTLMEEAQGEGFAIGLINSGAITEPGTALFVAQVEDRFDHAAIVLQIFEQRPDVILGGGEQWFLPEGVMGRHGPGRRADGRNLIEELIALGYTVVFNAEELAAIPENTTKLLGLFAAHHIFNADGEEELAVRNLPLYVEGSPTVAQKTAAALQILSRNETGFFLVVEEEGTDNFANRNNAEGTIEAAKRADDAIRVALDFTRTDQNTLLLVAADSDAGGLNVMTHVPWQPMIAGEPLPARMPGRRAIVEGGPVDGVGGTGKIPFVTPCGQPFAIIWAGLQDFGGGTITRAYGLHASLVAGTIDNTDIYRIMRFVLGL